MKKIILLVAVLLSGCLYDNPSPAAEASWYSRDPRTDLCFLGWIGSGGMKYYTTVPCSDEVLKEIEHEKNSTVRHL